MKSPLTIRSFGAHEWQLYRDLRLRSLADSPEAFGRTLAEEQQRADGDWASRLAAGATSAGDYPLVAEIDGVPAGLAWGRMEPADPETANLYQMWVAPGYRRRGAGRALLEAVIAWAAGRHARALELEVSSGNQAAESLYRRAGFEPFGDTRPLRPGSTLRSQQMRLDLSGRTPPSTGP